MAEPDHAIDSTKMLKALDELKDFQPPKNELEIQFIKEPLGDGKAVIESTVIDVTATEAKIVVLVTNAAQRVMVSCAQKLRKKVQELNIPGSQAAAEDSPTLRGQLDFVHYNVPKFQAQHIRSYYVKSLQEMYNND